jgi:nucleotide-binding universal stress UspA family protein
MTTRRRPLGNVLVALDLSTASAAIIERAARLPITSGSSITLFHVVPQGFGLPPVLDTATEREAQRVLATAAARISELTAEGVDVFTAVGHGTPFVEIIRRARHERVELVVLGRHGYRTFPDALIGSTAERVLRKGDVPLLIVSGMPNRAYRRPMVAVDLSDTARRALDLALRVTDPQADPLEVVHSCNVRAGGDPEERDGTDLARFLAEFGEAAARWRVTVGPGDARAVILAEAARREVDLLVLGTHGRSGITHLLLGSVAEAVVRAAKCDVLVARQPKRDFQLP